MLKPDFIATLSRLSASLGGKGYAPVQIDMAWDEIGKISANNFDAVVEKLVLTNLRVPPIGAVIQACKPFLRAIHEQELREKRKTLPHCRHCSGTGAFWAKSPSGYDTAFRCVKCPAAGMFGFSEAYAPWHDRLLADGWTPVSPGRPFYPKPGEVDL